MKLIAYSLGHDVKIKTSPLERDWMDETPHKFAYRCLPLNIANSFGWQILCKKDIEVIWNGSPDASGVQIRSEENDDGFPPALSHFGNGIITFSIPFIFRTEKNINLMVTGPINSYKDAIYPLSGVVETDWTCATFTMNWKFFRKNVSVKFLKDEPICHIFPVDTNMLEKCEPEIKSLEYSPDIEEQYYQWSNNRSDFLTRLKKQESTAMKEKWQKNYYHGNDVKQSTSESEITHRTKLKLKEFNIN